MFVYFKASLAIFLFVGFCNNALGQSYSYVQYTMANGLGSPTVYSMIQDKDGFMWFGTEAGLNRFDGTNFKTFTTKDGLPDNEILKMYQDSKGRIWMLPFRSSVCYYLDGKFYNQTNDPILKKLDIKERLLNIFEDSAGTMWMNDMNNIHKIYANGHTEKINDIAGIKLGSTLLLSKDDMNRIWFSVSNANKNKIYKIENGKVLLYKEYERLTAPNELLFSSTIRLWYQMPKSAIVIESDMYKSKDSVPSLSMPYYNTHSFVNDSIISFNTQRGAYIYNLRKKNFENILLANKSVSQIIKDAEGSWWISTLGEGVFRIHSENFKNIVTTGEIPSIKNVSSINLIDSTLYIGTEGFEIIKVHSKLIAYNIGLSKQLKFYDTKVLGFFKTKTRFVLITGKGILKLNDKYKIVNTGMFNFFPKYLYKKKDTVFCATVANIVRFDLSTFKVMDTVWSGRSTASYEKNGQIYIGTLSGLYSINSKKKSIYLGAKFPLLKSRISCFDETKDGSLWIGTNDNGVIQFRNDSILHHYSTSNGLSSNICRTICADGNNIWVGTNKGLNKVRLNDSVSKITKITKSDGLGSDLVNKIFIEGDTVFVGTSEGLTYFNKKLIDQYSECNLRVFDLTNDNALLKTDSTYTINNGSLKLNYVGISYKSADDIIYKYRLSGSDTTWKTTKETSLEFISLPYGNLMLEITAKNKFGVESSSVTIKFYVPTPFLKSMWFYGLAFFGFSAVSFFVYKRRLNKIQRREKEKTKLNKKIAQMELTALRAQMNPHFIFNVLNSIQYFIVYKDMASAQSYLAKFAKLIRFTLDHSQNIFIKLSDELIMLKIYLDLENMRFEKEFDYAISVEMDLKEESVLIPNMLIQPFVENAIKHAFTANNENAKMDIRILEKKHTIDFSIIDNGIGINRSKELARKNLSEHKSAGVNMVLDKIEVLKELYNYDLSIQVYDLSEQDSTMSGTKVLITIPKQPKEQ